ncbi:MAG TPA: hypothetical protein VGM23_05975, partial [Armatimonadota bacterium]
NQILIKHYAGLHELGGYAAAWQLTMITVLLIQQVARIGGPRLAAVAHEGASIGQQLRFLLAYLLVIVLLVLPIAGIFLFASKGIMTTFFNAEYRDATRILHPMGWYALLFAPGVVFEQFIVTVRMESAYLLSMLVSGVASVVLGILIIPSAGGYGAGWVLVLSYGLAVLIYLGTILTHFLHLRRQTVNRPAVVSATAATP